MQTDTQSFDRLSATNFDLPSLHLLHNEIDVALKDAETHLSEFNDDEEQAPLLLDSVEVIRQLSSVLRMVSLDGADALSQTLADCLQKLYELGDNTNTDLIMDISEGIMTLNRYIEFVLLKETLEPSLLLPIINKLRLYLNKSILPEDTFEQHNLASISIANPEQNYQSLAQMNLDSQLLTLAYRAGLGVVLNNKDGVVSAEDQQKLDAMAQACTLIANQSGTLFWQAAAAAVTDIAKVLPLNNAQKRTLIYVEQQFHDYLPVSDKRFADLVGFASQRDHHLAEVIKQKSSVNRLNEKQKNQMKRFLFGPNREVTDALNELIQEQIATIKEKVDNYTRNDDINHSIDTQQIAADLHTLGLTLQLLNLQEAADALKQEAKIVAQWEKPSPENFDHLLMSLMKAENASIHMAKLHTPGAINLPLHNHQISLHQLDTAYNILVQESRANIATIEQAINDYIADPNHDRMNISNIPEMMHQVAGAARFLELPEAASLIARLAVYVDEHLLPAQGVISNDILANVADVVMAVDYHLEGLENNHPVSKQALKIGRHSLDKLLVA